MLYWLSNFTRETQLVLCAAKGEGQEPGSIGEPGSYQALAVLGIALIAMGEDIGAEMALRTFSHLVCTIRPLHVCQCDVWLYIFCLVP